MRRLISAVGTVLLCTVTLFAQKQTISNEWPQRSEDFYQGCVKPISGERLDFLQNLQDQSVALLVRANQESAPIVFETQAFPDIPDGQPATFIWEMALATQVGGDARDFVLSVNGTTMFDFSTNTDTLNPDWVMQGSNGAELAFVHAFVDKAKGDLFGFMFLTVISDQYPAGEPLRISVAGKAQNSEDWYMAFQNHVGAYYEMLSMPALKEVAGTLRQPLEITFGHIGKPADFRIFVDGAERYQKRVRAGENKATIYLSEVGEKTNHRVRIERDDLTVHEGDIVQKPVRHFEVYFLPHSHVDIGFTHRQDEVERMQWRNFEEAIDLARRTQSYPERARYKWNVEVMWAVDGYLRQASPEKKAAFIEAVQNGWIGLDALYGSELTGLQRAEEMIQNSQFAVRLEEEFGIETETAMITDVPGYTWGTVPSLYENGVRYLSVGPNHMPHLPHGGYQVGYTFEAWGDVPFYWVSPSGNQRILFWMSTHGYSWFHDWLLGTLSKSGGSPVLGFLDELDEEGYPYDIVQLRYTMGDNAGPDQNMPAFIKNWNETYTWPKFRIATTARMFRDFEAMYGDQLPEFGGDFSPYWEDGAASSAHETGLNRNAADQLVLAEALWSMFQPDQFPKKIFEEAWTNVVLFSEHTWGSITSKSDPDGALATDQWEVKAGFAHKADSLAQALTVQALYAVRPPRELSEDDTLYIAVANPNSWSRSDVVTLAPHQFQVDRVLYDDQDKEVPIQQLSTGNWVFLADGVAPFSTKRYYTVKGKRSTFPNVQLTPDEMQNGLVRVRIDTSTGTLSGIWLTGDDYNYVDKDDPYGFNGYWYSGLNAKNPQSDGVPRFSVVEFGPVLSTVSIRTQAPGANSFERQVTLIKGKSGVFLKNTVDKLKQLEDENLRFSFPIQVNEGEWRLDIPYGILMPDKNQLKGANKNFLCPQRFIDISNAGRGLTIANLDAPLVEIGDMYGQDWMRDMRERPWLMKLPDSRRMFSWVMNNAWFVNYKGFQEGKIDFRYVIRPHEGFDNTEAKMFGIEQTMPLVGFPLSGKADLPVPPVNISGTGSVIAQTLKPSRDGSGFILRLFNTGKNTETVTLDFAGEGIIHRSNGKEAALEAIGPDLEIDGWDLVTVKFVRD